MAFDLRKYALRPLARSDLEGIWLYTRKRWSSEQADSYIRLIVNAFDGLANGTKRGRSVDVRKGYFKYAVGSHVIYYTDAEDGVVVARVLHGRMDVDRHL